MIFLSKFTVGLCLCVTHLIIRLNRKLFLCHLPFQIRNSLFVRSGFVGCKQAAPVLAPFTSCVIFSLYSLLPIERFRNIVVFCLIALVPSNWWHVRRSSRRKVGEIRKVVKDSSCSHSNSKWRICGCCWKVGELWLFELQKWRDSREQEMLLACNKPLYAEENHLI